MGVIVIRRLAATDEDEIGKGEGVKCLPGKKVAGEMLLVRKCHHIVSRPPQNDVPCGSQIWK